MLRIFALALLLTACDGNEGDGGGRPDPLTVPAPDADDRSGSRLKRRLYRTADGFTHQVGWFDSLLGRDCEFAPLADGSTRCVPGDAYIGLGFRDATCTDRVLFSGQALNATDFIRAGFDWRTGCSVTFWRDPQPLATPEQLYALSVLHGRCEDRGVSPHQFYSATEIAPSEFVAETVVLDPAGSELQARVRVTDDGARQFLNVFSPALDDDCAPGLRSDGSAYCVPLSNTSVYDPDPVYGDPDCTQGLYNVQPCINSRKYQRDNSEDYGYCDEGHEYAPLSEHTGDIFLATHPGCMRFPGGQYQYAAAGMTMAATAYVATSSRAIGDATTRLRPLYNIYADGSVGPRVAWDVLGLVAPRTFWDTLHETECQFTSPLSAPLLQCVPATWLEHSGYFVDRSCTRPLANNLGHKPCPAARRPAWAQLAGGTYRRVTGEYGLTVAYRMTDEGCRPLVPSGQLFRLSDEDVTNWEEVTTVVEP